jgi:hypothetical protein
MDEVRKADMEVDRTVVAPEVPDRVRLLTWHG